MMEFDRSGHVTRREAVKLMALGAMLPAWSWHVPDEGQIMTVRGAIRPGELGRALIHEHVMVDFAPANVVGAHRYDPEAVIERAGPHLQALRGYGVQAFFDCTPAYLGRDPLVLRRLASRTGLHIVTNTGYYGARDDVHLPPHTFDDEADALAARWVSEWRHGIDGTGIRPGFIKLGVDAGSLSEVDRKLVRAGARAHRDTGLTLAVHTGPAVGAFEQLQVLEEEGVLPDAWVWVHAQAEPDVARLVEAAARGGWVSLDGVGWGDLEGYVRRLVTLREAGLLHRVLVSHDAGWYDVETPGGGPFKPYTRIFTELLPALADAGLDEADVHQLLIVNPAEAFTVRTRLAGTRHR